MRPTPDQIRVAAYYRWRRGGEVHGRDLADWVAAEQGLLFALNYEVIAHHRLDDDTPRHLGHKGRRVCRFCEQSPPRANFVGPAHAVPECLGNSALLALDQCEACRAFFAETIEPALEGLICACRAIPPARAERPEMSIAALKGLARVALAIMPEEELDYFPDAIEWVLNPDHELDGATFGGLGCYVYPSPEPAAPAWVALARRIEDEAPVPYMLAFAGTPHATFEIAVPLCGRDEDREGEDLAVPRVASPSGLAEGAGEARCVFIPVSSARARRPLESRAV
jgi:hypothetical protein